MSLGARRVDRLAAVVDGGFCHELDVTNAASVEAFVHAAIAKHGPIDVLVNNAGLARGTEKIAEGTGEAWREMIETNVLGLLEVKCLYGQRDRRRLDLSRTPARHAHQVQGAMALAGVEWCDLVCWIPADVRVFGAARVAKSFNARDAAQ